MKKNKNERIKKSLLILIIFSTASIFTACNVVDEAIDVADQSVEVNTDELPIDIDLNSSDMDANIQFYHAWLADCVNDTAFASQKVAQTQLTALANARIRAAIIDPAIVHGFGPTELKEELVWGPVVIVEPTDLDSTMYAAANVMYCLKKQGSGRFSYYSIGISGTNMISTYDWFSEDFNAAADGQYGWTQTGGKISQGSISGFRLLSSMVSNGNTLQEFLQTDAKEYKGSTIDVSGHSLGGTLTQVYSSYLKNKMMIAGLKNVYVRASVYAGPTAGNSKFAIGLVNQLDGYHAYNNTLDAIPHAWQSSTLDKLCSLYKDKNLCYWTIDECPSINGVMKYLQLTSQGGDYTMPGVPTDTTQFTGKLLTPSGDECLSMFAGFEIYYHDRADSYLMKDLVKVHDLCSPSAPITDTQVFNFFSYLSEMGYQHTTAYFDYFITNSATRIALNNHVPGAKSALNLGVSGEQILDEFLKKIYAELSAKGVTSCSCDQ